MSAFPYDVIAKVASRLLGTADSVETAINALDFEEDLARDLVDRIDEVEDRILDFSVERCQGCEWWHESSELSSIDDRPDGYCDPCRDEIFGKPDED